MKAYYYPSRSQTQEVMTLMVEIMIGFKLIYYKKSTLNIIKSKSFFFCINFHLVKSIHVDLN